MAPLVSSLVLPLQLWEEEKLEFPVFFLSHVSSSMVEFVKGMLEWLNDVAAREFDQSRINPFNFKWVSGGSAGAG